MEQRPAPPLLASQALDTIANPNRTAQLSGSYVLHISATSSYYAAAASSPSDAIHLFDKQTLAAAQKLSGHADGITAMRVVEKVGSSSSAIASCGKDGIVKIWDDRTGVVALEMRGKGRPCGLLSMDVSPDGLSVAAGTELVKDDAYIYFWDPRHPAAPLRTHGATHSDDVTSVQFAPNITTRLLLSASTDGLVSTSNPDENDEDEAGVAVGNWGCSISQAGWISPVAIKSQPMVWAASDMETFSLWTEELDSLQDFDIRQPKLDGAQRWSTDYLIGCQTTAVPISDNDSGLRVFAGSNDGGLAIFTPSILGDNSAPWTVHRILRSEVHTGVVRSAFWDENAGVIVTGGEEDGKLCVWSCPPLQDSTISTFLPGSGAGLGGRGVLREESEDRTTDEDAMEVDEPRRRRRTDDNTEAESSRKKVKKE